MSVVIVEAAQGMRLWMLRVFALGPVFMGYEM